MSSFFLMPTSIFTASARACVDMSLIMMQFISWFLLLTHWSSLMSSFALINLKFSLPGTLCMGV